MKKFALIAAAGLAAAAFAEPASAQPRSPVPAQVSVCFVPAESCRGEIVAAIAGAKREVRVHAFRFDVPEIADALVAAKKRGVDVSIIFDDKVEKVAREGACKGSDANYDVAEEIVDAGIPAWVDTAVKTAHNKTLIVDGELVLGGSYNYAERVETKNADNLITIRSRDVAAWYLQNWNSRKAASRPLKPLTCKS